MGYIVHAVPFFFLSNDSSRAFTRANDAIFGVRVRVASCRAVCHPRRKRCKRFIPLSGFKRRSLASWRKWIRVIAFAILVVSQNAVVMNYSTRRCYIRCSKCNTVGSVVYIDIIKPIRKTLYTRSKITIISCLLLGNKFLKSCWPRSWRCEI